MTELLRGRNWWEAGKLALFFIGLFFMIVLVERSRGGFMTGRALYARLGLALWSGLLIGVGASRGEKATLVVGMLSLWLLVMVLIPTCGRGRK